MPKFERQFVITVTTDHKLTETECAAVAHDFSNRLVGHSTECPSCLKAARIDLNVNYQPKRRKDKYFCFDCRTQNMLYSSLVNDTCPHCSSINVFPELTPAEDVFKLMSTEMREPDIIKEKPELGKFWNHNRKNNWDYGCNPYAPEERKSICSVKGCGKITITFMDRTLCEEHHDEKYKSFFNR